MNPRRALAAESWLWLVLLMSMLARNADAGSIHGVVRDTHGTPLPQAIVGVLETNPPLGVSTDSVGGYFIPNVPVAPCRVVVKRFGFSDLIQAVRFEPDGTARLDIVMKGTAPSELFPYAPGSSPSPELVESWPGETTLDTSLSDAADSWSTHLAYASNSIDLAEFYVSDNPSARSSLTELLDILINRAAHGVKIRLLVDEKFFKTYPGIVTQLDSLENVQSRRLDYGAIAGGILHAKYFIIDGKWGYLGSQNFDWRALEHIQELGVMFSDFPALDGLTSVFQRDWDRGVPVDSSLVEASWNRWWTDAGSSAWTLDAAGDTCRWQFVASPKDDLPADVEWDLPRLVGLIDAAHDSIEVQLLTYKPKNRNGEMWDELDGALRRAASRGVQVKFLLANWGKRKGTVEYLQELSAVPGFELRFMNIPEASTGFIPFARTVHAKYMVVDETAFWVGTSNWERDYFYNSRNVGIAGSGNLMAKQLAGFFATGWNSSYAERIQADVIYTPPRIAE